MKLLTSAKSPRYYFLALSCLIMSFASFADESSNLKPGLYTANCPTSERDVKLYLKEDSAFIQEGDYFHDVISLKETGENKVTGTALQYNLDDTSYNRLVIRTNDEGRPISFKFRDGMTLIKCTVTQEEANN